MKKLVNGQEIELTQAEIDARLAEEAAQAIKDAEYDSKQYQRDRGKEYPPIGDQLDALWHAMDNNLLGQVPGFYDVIKAVKDKHPKPV